MRDISCGDDVTLNANPSYDPDFPEENGTLRFLHQISCHIKNNMENNRDNSMFQCSQSLSSVISVAT